MKYTPNDIKIITAIQKQDLFLILLLPYYAKVFSDMCQGQKLEIDEEYVYNLNFAGDCLAKHRNSNVQYQLS